MSCQYCSLRYVVTLGAVHYALLLRLKILNFENELGKKKLFSEDNVARSHEEIIQFLCVNCCSAKASISSSLHLCLRYISKILF